MRLSALVILICAICANSACGYRIFKSRKNAMASLSGATKESQQYFGSCEQSSNEQTCELAIDSDASSEWTQCAAAYPIHNEEAWWKGYLENPIYVVSVYIQSAEMQLVGEPNGLADFVISGSGHNCYTHKEIGNSSFSSMTFPCDVLADSIEIRSKVRDGVLGLCDVHVQGAALSFSKLLEPNGTLLTYLECEQTSAQGSRNCWYAYDGVKEQKNINKCSMTQPRDEKPEWWKAIFTTAALVQEVVIYNRADGHQKGMTNFEVNIGKRICVRYNSPDEFERRSWKCNHFGGDIQILQRARHALTLCEVEVIGHEVEMVIEKKRKPLGCYVGLDNEAPLGDDFKDPISFTFIHEEKCDRMCRRVKAKYFGLHDGSECWCGSSFGQNGKADDAMCRLECSGKRGELCGGVKHTAVFEIL